MNWRTLRRRNTRKPFDPRKELKAEFEVLDECFQGVDRHRLRDKDFRAARRCGLDLLRLLSILNNPLIWRYLEYAGIPGKRPRQGAGRQARKREESIAIHRSKLMKESATVTELETALRFLAREFRSLYKAFRKTVYKPGREHKEVAQQHAFRCGTMLPAVIRHFERTEWTALRVRV